MQRRTLLRRSAALGTIALAGCLANGDDSNDGGGETPTDRDDGTDAPGTDTPGSDGPTPSPSPSGVDDSSIETTKTGCAGEDTGSASVGFDPDTYRVTVEGVLQAANPCHLAALESATYDGDTTVLELVVVATDDPDAEMCAQCLGAIDYAASVDLDGGLPGTVRVVHGTGENAETVTEVSRDDR